MLWNVPECPNWTSLIVILVTSREYGRIVQPPLPGRHPTNASRNDLQITEMSWFHLWPPMVLFWRNLLALPVLASIKSELLNIRQFFCHTGVHAAEWIKICCLPRPSVYALQKWREIIIMMSNIGSGYVVLTWHLYGRLTNTVQWPMRHTGSRSLVNLLSSSRYTKNKENTHTYGETW